jgi:hypothetical protein
MTKKYRSIAQRSAIQKAQIAHKLPPDILSREYQIHLTEDVAEWFKGLSTADRGAIVLAGKLQEFGESDD